MAMGATDRAPVRAEGGCSVLWPGSAAPSPDAAAAPKHRLTVVDSDAVDAVGATQRFARAHQGALSYNSGRIEFRPDGTVSFVDLTRDQVPLAQRLARDPAQRARLAEIQTDWAGGRDPGAPEAGYVALHRSGELARRIEALRAVRERDAYGVFGRARVPFRIGGYNLNVGEEREISGVLGTDTVYFSGCSMGCVFCQYADIAHAKGGADLEVARLADIFLKLQEEGAHNIQLMTPSHFIVEILEAVDQAAARGLSIPLVYNTGGYEDLDALRLLDGVVDVYLPDVKFGNNEAGLKYGATKGYWDNVQDAVREMHRQVGPLATDDRGIATQGVLVRHLLMPQDVADVTPIASFVAALDPALPVHVMPQWTPSYATARFPEINQATTADEHEAALAAFARAGVQLWQAPYEAFPSIAGPDASASA